MPRRSAGLPGAIVIAMIATVVTAGRIVRAAGETNESARTPWTTSHVHGSPEPPPPYRTERAYPALTFKNPLDITFAQGSNRIFVAEQSGRIWSFPDNDRVDHADLFADLPTELRNLDKVPYANGVGAIYGFAFHPQFATHRYVYICYVLNFAPPPGVTLTPANQHGTRVSRFTVTDTDPPRIDPASEVVLIDWYAGGHNGGCVKFGPDGDLYISSGDGGDPDPPDPFNTGQDISDLLCSILRIDVDHPGPGGRPYSIPADNPFAHLPGARPEVYAYGLRNPWRMNFDSRSGRLWVGDVGWELWESVHCVKSGGNYGWSIMEGPNPVHPLGKRGPTPITPPLIALSHAEAASLTGGFVYHGRKLPELDDCYLFGDWQTSRLWAAKCHDDRLEPHRLIAQTQQRIVAFGERPDGEPLIVDHQGGGLWRIVPNEAAGRPSHFPRKLSETGLFASVAEQKPAPGVIPFSVNAPQWLDGATARRWVAVPGTERRSWGKGVWGDDRLTWPSDTVLVRTLSLGSAPIETQLLHFDGLQWQAYSYRWNADRTDADLVAADGERTSVEIPDAGAPGHSERRVWNFASRAQCLTCHNVWCDFTFGFDPGQLDRDGDFDGVTKNQVSEFHRIGLLDDPRPTNDPPSHERLTLTDPYSESADVTERARSYLHVNCSPCHRFGGGGSALFDVRKELPSDHLNLIDAKPNLGDFGIDRARLVSPGDPDRSVLIYRMSKLGTGRMPHIGSDVVDVQGVELIRRWTQQLPGTSPAPDSALAAIETLSTVPAAVASNADRLLASTDGALALLDAIDRSKLPPAARAVAVAHGIAASDTRVRDLFRRFDSFAQQADRLGPDIRPATILALTGDPERGRRVFFEPAASALCARCHTVAGRGTDFGPDLSHIAAKYGRADLLDNILNPSKSIAPGFTTYIVRTKSGDVLSGFLLSQTSAAITIKDAQLHRVTIRSADIDRLAPQSVSAMPEGLLADLTARQAADLLAFLSTLK